MEVKMKLFWAFPSLDVYPIKGRLEIVLNTPLKFNIFCPFNLVSEQSKALPVLTTEARRLGCCRRRLPPPAAATARCHCLPLFAAVVLTDFQLISDEEYQEFLRFKSNNHAQSSASPSVSTTCISHSMGNQGPWIIDSGASDHIS
ncbi:hypothetical protein CR513_48240, partial [Mucuna pruriens]